MTDYRIIKNTLLPANTLVVSPDVFALLTDTPEQAEAKCKELRANVTKLFELIDKRKKEEKANAVIKPS